MINLGKGFQSKHEQSLKKCLQFSKRNITKLLQQSQKSSNFFLYHQNKKMKIKPIQLETYMFPPFSILIL